MKRENARLIALCEKKGIDTRTRREKVAANQPQRGEHQRSDAQRGDRQRSTASRSSRTEAFWKTDNSDGATQDEDNSAPFELSCFWCGGKGHTLFDCPDPPPNAKAKAARDMVVAAKANRAAKAEIRQARRLAPAANSVQVSDDEDDDYEQALFKSGSASAHDTYKKIQALFEKTKPCH